MYWQVRFPGGLVTKNLTANSRDVGSVPESGRSPGEENGNPLHYSCLGNPMEREPVGLQLMASYESDMT